MQALGYNPRLISVLSRPSSRLNLRPFSSSSSSDYSDQSRGGLPRFFSETLPSLKARKVLIGKEATFNFLRTSLENLQGGIVRVKGDEFWHMTRVLRLGVNDRVELFNGKGGLVEGRIEKIDVAGVDLEATESPKLVSPQATQWHIFAAFSTLKGGRADWLVEKCTELGASSVTPLLTERSNSISENRVDRLQRLILAATKQCQRLHEMILKPPITVVNLLPIVGQSRLSLVAVAEATPVLNTLRVLNKETAGIVIIGPEGDFTDKELISLTEAGATAVGLGPHRLRVETATIALLSTLMLWSDSQEAISNESPIFPLSPHQTPSYRHTHHSAPPSNSELKAPYKKMAIQLENLVESIKSKVRSLKKSKKPYVKMDKSASVRVEIRSRKAKKLIDKTLKAADRPGKKHIP
ncbi:ribosomal RNA small subunit methyltransferase E [Striga asiatica]|uniref:16S rRNA (uracil(1498)-N(3))-methyltransferase n=1 Tax=Striga asiatica TaxID=4170 RepID=A0A5A7PXV4_STRAF|nr:ribosomal RNA small subunit methyltransferase E [Striga asiatica]